MDGRWTDWRRCHACCPPRARRVYSPEYNLQFCVEQGISTSLSMMCSEYSIAVLPSGEIPSQPTQSTPFKLVSMQNKSDTAVIWHAEQYAYHLDKSRWSMSPATSGLLREGIRRRSACCSAQSASPEEKCSMHLKRKQLWHDSCRLNSAPQPSFH